ncbi:hypothetical protein TKK_0005318 [Trichogramma kaykai]|uniref:Uncharacterized protein n=1 Tax=Trichogramma kaykai TaxID=54128 RepID=A0ABD2XI90_9HYME
MRLASIQKVGAAGSCFFLLGLIMQTQISPALLQYATKKSVCLKEGNMFRSIWSKLPFAIEFRVYMFNVTNHEDVEATGAKPIVREIGPYVYDMWHEKIKQRDRDEDDTVAFVVKDTFYYNKTKSKKLTGDEEIIVPHYFMLGMIHTILRVHPTTLPLIVKGLNSIFRKPSSMFIKAKVREILIDGLPIDCNVTDSAGLAICNELHAKWEEYHLKKLDTKTFALSVIGWMNASEDGDEYRVKRGIADVMEVGKIVALNDQEKLSVWDDEVCDSFHGTAGILYQPFFDKTGKDVLAIFASELCRSLVVYYESIGQFKGMRTLRYTADFGVDVDSHPHHRCYCHKSASCQMKGIFDLYKCVGTPIIVSHPHFFDADPYFITTVEGLSTNKKKHKIIADFHPSTGALINANFRAQVNMFLTKVEKFKLMRNFPEALLPLFWVDNVVILPKWILRILKMSDKIITSMELVNFTMIFGGLAMLLFAVFQYQQSIHVTSLVLEQKSTQTDAAGSSGPVAGHDDRAPQQNLVTMLTRNVDRQAELAEGRAKTAVYHQNSISVQPRAYSSYLE